MSPRVNACRSTGGRQCECTSFRASCALASSMYFSFQPCNAPCTPFMVSSRPLNRLKFANSSWGKKQQVNCLLTFARRGQTRIPCTASAIEQAVQPSFRHARAWHRSAFATQHFLLAKCACRPGNDAIMNTSPTAHTNRQPQPQPQRAATATRTFSCWFSSNTSNT